MARERKGRDKFSKLTRTSIYLISQITWELVSYTHREKVVFEK